MFFIVWIYHYDQMGFTIITKCKSVLRYNFRKQDSEAVLTASILGKIKIYKILKRTVIFIQQLQNIGTFLG